MLVCCFRHRSQRKVHGAGRRTGLDDPATAPAPYDEHSPLWRLDQLPDAVYRVGTRVKRCYVCGLRHCRENDNDADDWFPPGDDTCARYRDWSGAHRLRDHAGRLNQAMAARAERVVFIAAGLPLTLKENNRHA